MTRDSEGGWTISTAIYWQWVDMNRPAAGTVIGLGLSHVQGAEPEKAVECNAARSGPPAVFRFGRLVLE